MNYLKPTKPILLWNSTWDKSPKWKTTNAYDELQWILEELTCKIQAECSEVLVKLKFDHGSTTDAEVITVITDEFGQYNTCLNDWLEGRPSVYIEWICPVSYVADLMSNVENKE